MTTCCSEVNILILLPYPLTISSSELNSVQPLLVCFKHVETINNIYTFENILPLIIPFKSAPTTAVMKSPVQIMSIIISNHVLYFHSQFNNPWIPSLTPRNTAKYAKQPQHAAKACQLFRNAASIPRRSFRITPHHSEQCHTFAAVVAASALRNFGELPPV
jgi:hypothetical protein